MYRRTPAVGSYFYPSAVPRFLQCGAAEAAGEKLPKQDCMNEYANIISKSNAREKENRKKQIELAEGKKNNDTDENRNSYNQPVRKISKKRNITNCKKKNNESCPEWKRKR